jgi:hypothetical protein
MVLLHLIRTLQTLRLTNLQETGVCKLCIRQFVSSFSGYVADSKFRIIEKDAYNCISITCIRYLMLCVANMAKGIPGYQIFGFRALRK